MKILILIIANDDHPHLIALQQIWKKYMNTVDNVKSFFIKSNPNIDSNYIDDDTIYIKSEESLIPGVLIKTLESFRMLYKDYDYIYRTNLSSFVNIEKLYNLCRETRRENVYAGIRGYYHLDPRISFISGAGFLLSRDMMELLFEKESLLDYNKIDDVAIGEILFSENRMVGNFSHRYDILTGNEVISDTIIKDHFHYRIKVSCSSLEERSQELQIHERLFSMIYETN